MNYYSIAVQGRGVGVTVTLGEYQLYSSQRAMHGHSAHLNAWLNKENRLNIRAVKTQGPTPDEEPPEETDPGYWIEVIVWYYRDGEVPVRVAGFRQDGTLIPGPDWTVFDTARPDFETSHILDFQTAEDFEIVAKPWETPEAAPFDARVAYQLYATIHKAFRTGDFETLATLSQPRIDFGSKVFGIPAAVFENDVREDLRSALAGGLTWRELVPEHQVILQPIRDGMVIRVLDAKGNPPLRSLPDTDGIETGYDLVFAVASACHWIL